MSSTQGLAQDNIWFDKLRFEEAEVAYQEHLSHLRSGGQGQVTKCEKANTCTASSPIRSSLAGEIAKAREHIQKSLNSSVGASPSECFVKRVASLEEENKELKKVVKDLENLVNTLTSRVAALEHGSSAPNSTAKSPAAQQAPAAVANHKKDEDEAGDEDFELFGSDDEVEDVEADRVKQERLQAYEAKKSTKPVLIAKSNIILDVKPWDDETDMKELEKCVRSIEMDGLLWGASKLVPLAYGIKKLQISCVVEDDKISTDDLEEKITAFEDFIQSMDIAAFNKV